jgi:hypothetical protein
MKALYGFPQWEGHIQPDLRKANLSHSRSDVHGQYCFSKPQADLITGTTQLDAFSTSPKCERITTRWLRSRRSTPLGPFCRPPADSLDFGSAGSDRLAASPC